MLLWRGGFGQLLYTNFLFVQYGFLVHTSLFLYISKASTACEQLLSMLRFHPFATR